MVGKLEPSIMFLSNMSKPSFRNQLELDIRNAQAVDIIIGFMSVEGLKFLEDSLLSRSNITYRIVIGHGKLDTLEELSKLVSLKKLRKNCIKLHFGLMRTRKKDQMRRESMMHSKLLYLTMSNNIDVVYVGSYNLTKPALENQNFEAGVRICADRGLDFMRKIREYIDRVWDQSIPYNPAKNVIYAWMFNENVKQLLDSKIAEKIHAELGIRPSYNTFILAVVNASIEEPKEGGIIDIDARWLRQQKPVIKGTQLHIYLLTSEKKLSPILQRVIDNADTLLICGVSADIDTGKGGLLGSPAKPLRHYKGAIRYSHDGKTLYLYSAESIIDQELGIKGSRQIHAVIKNIIKGRDKIKCYHYFEKDALKPESIIEPVQGVVVIPGWTTIKDLRLRPIQVVKESVGMRCRQPEAFYVWTADYVSSA